MKKNILLFCLFLLFTSLKAQEFEILFQQCYGGTDFDMPYAIYRQAGGGFRRPACVSTGLGRYCSAGPGSRGFLLAAGISNGSR